MNNKKECKICGYNKSIELFYRHKNNKDGHLGSCISCSRKRMIQNYRNRADYYKKRQQTLYRTSEETYMNAKYAALKQRAEGKASHGHSSEGKRYLSKRAFQMWWKKNRDVFLPLYAAWKESGFKPEVAPSIDRISPGKGYIASNMQWLTNQQNTRKHGKRNYKVS